MGRTFLLALLAAVPVLAQEPSASAITLADALSRADAHAPEVASSAAQALVARADVGVAGMFPNFRIGAGASPSYLFIADFYILLPIFGQRETAEDAAASSWHAAEAGVEVTRLDARLAAALAWTELWAAQGELALASEDAERRDRLLAAARDRFDHGATPRLDVVRAQADAARAHAEVGALTETLEAAAARLRAAMGEPAGASLRAAGDPIDEGAAPPRAADLDAILAAHPVAERAHALTHAADAAVERDHRARWPRIGLAAQDWVSRQTELHDFRVIVTMEVPVFDEPRITRSEAARAAVRVDEDSIALRLRAGLIAARADYAAARARGDALAQEVLPAAREAADLATEAYGRGALDLSSAIAAEQGRADAERALMRATADCGRTWARLQHAMGGWHRAQ